MRTLADIRAELVSQYPQPKTRAKRTPKPKAKLERGVRPVKPADAIKRIPFTRYAIKQDLPIQILRLIEGEQLHFICSKENIKYLRSQVQWHNQKVGVIRKRYPFRAQTTFEGLLVTRILRGNY